MIRGYVPLLAIIAAIWGASYLFIKVAVDEVEPTAMMFFRLVLATAVLLPVLLWLSPRSNSHGEGLEPFIPLLVASIVIVVLLLPILRRTRVDVASR